MTYFRLISNQCAENHFWNHEKQRKNSPAQLQPNWNWYLLQSLESCLLAEEDFSQLVSKVWWYAATAGLVTPSGLCLSDHDSQEGPQQASEDSLALFKNHILSWTYMPMIEESGINRGDIQRNKRKALFVWGKTQTSHDLTLSRTLLHPTKKSSTIQGKTTDFGDRQLWA